MPSDDDGLTRKQQLAWALAAFLIVSSTAAIAENFTGGFGASSGQGGGPDLNSGPQIIFGQNWEHRGGQPATNGQAYNLSTKNDGWINVSGEADGPVIQIDTINETWTNTSSISGTGSANITLNPSNKNETAVGGSITAFKFNETKVNDSSIDVIYSASGDATIKVKTNATKGVQYGLVDPDTDQGLDVAAAGSNGWINFTEVPAGTDQQARIQDLGTLVIREEVADHPKITGCTAEAMFFEIGSDDDPTIINKSDGGNGEIDLTGLPVDSEFAVAISCAGYHNRTILLPDLSQQETVYLLNKSDDTVTVTFDIQDNTGEFSESGTDFVVQRAINRSLFDTGGFSWDNMAGDEIGASSSVRHVLNKEARYRLEITNDEGDTRILGAHVAEANQTVPIRINDVDIDANESQGYNWNLSRINSSGNIFVQFAYVDNENKTTQVELTIHEFGNDSNVLHDDTHSGEFGTLLVTEQVTGDDKNTTWVADFTATRDGEEVTGKQVSGRSTNPLGVPLDDDWKNRIAILSLVLIGFVVGGGVRPDVGALAVVATAGMWHFIGWMPPEVTGVSIGIASLVAVAHTVGTRRGEPVG